MQYKAVIFDMDGTILDTAGDLTSSVNYAMGKCGHKHDYVREQGKRLFGSGAHAALQRALAIEAGITDPAKLREIGTPEMMTVPGIDESEVARIEAVFRPYYLEHSMDETGPYDGIMDLLHTLRPDMVQAVLKDFGIAPEEALYIGDTEIDIQTAANTGMPCVCVSWGFRSVDFLRSMNPFAIIDTPAELLDLL